MNSGGVSLLDLFVLLEWKQSHGLLHRHGRRGNVHFQSPQRPGSGQPNTATTSTLADPPGDRNLLSGNTSTAISVTLGSNALVQGNLLGSDISGAALLDTNSTNTQIDVRGETPGALIRDNVVGGAIRGMLLGNSNDTMPGMTVLHNWVGTDVTGTVDLGAYGDGIFLLGLDIQVGGIGAGEGNVIAFCQGAGVLLASARSTFLELRSAGPPSTATALSASISEIRGGSGKAA